MRLDVYRIILYLTENMYINPKKLKFNYDKKVITYYGKVIVEGGRCISDEFLGIPIEDGLYFNVDIQSNFIDMLEEFYSEYYMSERQHTKGINFVSKQSDMNSDILLLCDDYHSEYTRVRLESFLYCVIVGKLYSWEFGSNWFWYSKKYRNLYLYRRWFT